MALCHFTKQAYTLKQYLVGNTIQYIFKPATEKQIKFWLYPESVPLWLISHIRNNGHHIELSPLNGLKGTITGYSPNF